MSEATPKTAVVTGGARGIGRAIVLHLAGLGYRVAILDLDAKLAAATASEAPGITAYTVDITDYEAVTSTIAQVVRDLGTPWLLVNNAAWDVPAPFLETSPVNWRKIIDINLIGCLNLHHAVLPAMIAAKGGRIVNISSDAARMPQFNVATYAACKAGMISLTKSLAKEFAAQGILINAICPGITKTPLLENVIATRPDGAAWVDSIVQTIPLARIAVPDDYPPIIAFLASEGASYITGQTISVNGGKSMM